MDLSIETTTITDKHIRLMTYDTPYKLQTNYIQNHIVYKNTFSKMYGGLCVNQRFFAYLKHSALTLDPPYTLQFEAHSDRFDGDFCGFKNVRSKSMYVGQCVNILMVLERP
jgi:hypothetical protein